MTARPVLILFVGLGVLPALRAEDKPPSPDGVEFFEKRIRPLLVKHCYECHGPDAKKVGGGLRLDTRDGVRTGGGRGPAIVPGEPAKSLLLNAVRQIDELKMPPKSKLSAEEIADLEAWVKNGAADPRTGIALTQTEPKRGRDLWSLKPVRDPPVPAVNDASWPLSPIDRFLLSKLEEKGLKPAGPADKRTLIRRASFDLTGLPPTPEEIDGFLADESPGAFAKVIDRLLASRAYGERWGRHWLDVVRYADTAGDNSDYPIPQAYKYRNWVIDAINADMPYDEFVRRQLAGDLLPATDDADRHAKLIATGYLANARRFGSYDDLGNGLPYPWYLTYEDTIDNLGRTFLGLTINCCRCHDHKFDPLTQQDYYALYGFFQSTRYPWPGIELDKVQRELVPLVPAEQVTAVENARRDRLAGFDARVKEMQSDKATTDKAAKTLGYFSTVGAAAITVRSNKLVESIKAAKKSKEDFEKQPLPYPTAYAVADRPAAGKRKAGNASLQIKGDPERPGPEIPRRFPTILGGKSLPPDAKGSGRLELARWIVDPANPLTARVMVNRIWQYHFGRGVVPTPSDFGMQGQPPTHPELLDYLASRFVEDGWSLRAMHRRMMLSRAYQMSSADDAANAKLDVDNEFLWHFPRRRLDAESIRDALLAVSGALDRSPGGPHPFPAMPTWDFTQHKPFKAVYDTDRRSVYLMTQRIQRHPFLAIFDGADPNASTATRVTSTTPLQALYLMNDPFVHARASGFAKRLLSERPDDTSRVERAYQLLFGRPPTSEETASARDHLGRVADKLQNGGVSTDQITAKAWESLARGLMLSNEFVYVD
jgi:Protein of unknown function (DUF1553)/Protein of unknown function (DUF1549)/Planctomycete cytochrome C